jgi:O-acetyl-ADP-ribose deacetylase (regulator of RNase III)
MITYIKDKDIFESDCEVIANPINCVGIMGGGLALAFKNKFPKMYIKYKEMCANREIIPGKVYLVDGDEKHKVLLFPTKDHYKYMSRYKFITGGLRSLVRQYKDWGIKSIALPALGCGLGGLDWDDVKFAIEDELKELSKEIRIDVYLPQ